MENNKDTQVVETPETTNEEAEVEKTFTQEEVNELVGSVRTKEKEKNEKAITEAVANAIKEYERQSKLTQEEKEKEMKAKQDALLKEREQEITIRENKLSAIDKLQSKGIPISLVEFVVDVDEKKTDEKIDKLAEIYSQSVELGVNNKLKGKTPTDFNQNQIKKPKKVSRTF